jgi:hypothetical protein
MPYLGVDQMRATGENSLMTSVVVIGERTL